MTAHDRTVRIVVLALGLVAVLALALVGAVALLERDASDVLLGALVSTLGAAVGALGSLLSQTGRSAGETPADPAYVSRVDDLALDERIDLNREP